MIGYVFCGIGVFLFFGCFNLYLELIILFLEELMVDIKEGLFVNNMFGFLINLIIGDYSVGVLGYWIENGEIIFLVNEIIIVGNLVEMFKVLMFVSDL